MAPVTMQDSGNAGAVEDLRMNVDQEGTPLDSKKSKKETAQKKTNEEALEEFDLEGLPPINVGALFMPPIWGAAHGIWIAILYYPAWLLIDNLLYGVYENPEPLTVVFAILAVIVLAAGTIFFARISQSYGLMRALKAGKTKEQYRKTQVKWAVAMTIVAVIMLVAATYYNLVIRPTL